MREQQDIIGYSNIVPHLMRKTKGRTLDGYGSPITIGDDVWIGGHSTILPGVTIGVGAVIAAGSVVTCDVAPRTLVAGNPARFKKTII